MCCAYINLNPDSGVLAGFYQSALFGLQQTAPALLLGDRQ